MDPATSIRKSYRANISNTRFIIPHNSSHQNQPYISHRPSTGHILGQPVGHGIGQLLGHSPR